jgi:hypothetical protein
MPVNFRPYLDDNVYYLRLKDVQQEKYTRDEAERGAGKSVEILPSVNAARLMPTI